MTEPSYRPWAFIPALRTTSKLADTFEMKTDLVFRI